MSRPGPAGSPRWPVRRRPSAGSWWPATPARPPAAPVRTPPRSPATAGRPGRRCPAGWSSRTPPAPPTIPAPQPRSAEPSRSSMSCDGAHRALDAAHRVPLQQVRKPLVGLQHLLAPPRRTACPGWSPGPARCATGRPSPDRRTRPPGGPAGPAPRRSGPGSAAASCRIWVCSMFSVRSRLVIPLCTCSCPASALNSSIRALTSCRVIRSRAAIDARSTRSMTAS